jgi:hypothetical protein
MIQKIPKNRLIRINKGTTRLIIEMEENLEGAIKGSR